MNPAIEMTITGNVDDGFTVAELVCLMHGERHLIGRVYEREDGWHYDTVSTVTTLGISPECFIAEIEKAKIALRRYPNRKGTNPPSGLSAAELSLWLLVKDER